MDSYQQTAFNFDLYRRNIDYANYLCYFQLYDRLKEEKPDFAGKVVMIEGGLDDTGLVISPENREMLKNSHVVFHGAATVRFDDKLRFAVNINVRGTKEILIFAREMPNLKVRISSSSLHLLIDKYLNN